MERYDVRIFPTAQQDLMDLIDYINTLSKEAALNDYDKLVSEIASLSTMPERYPRSRDLALAAKGYRYLVVGNYLVFYVIVGPAVQIRRILYAKRDYKQLLCFRSGRKCPLRFYMILRDGLESFCFFRCRTVA